MGSQVQPKCFWHPQHMRNNWELRKRGYLIRFGHTEALLLKKNMTLNGHFSRPAETDPYVSNGPLSHVLGIMRVLCSNCLIFLHLVVLLNYTNNNIDIDSIIGRCFKQSSPSIQQTINYSSKKCWVFGVVLEGCSFSLFFHCKYNVSKISIHH